MARRPVTRTVAYAATDEELFREQMLASASGDGADPRTFGYMLVKAAELRVWERLSFGTFREFLIAPVDRGGLGMTIERLRHAAALAGAEAQKAVETLLREEIPEAKVGRGRPAASNSDGTRITQDHSASAITARLKRDDPELAEKVVNGEMSAYAAARMKGWRPPRIQVTTPERTAEHLRKHMTPEQLSTLARLLLEG